MANNAQLQPSKRPELPQLDEEQLQEKLDYLCDLHIQLRGLRTAIPRMIAPLCTKQPSRTSLACLLRSFADPASAQVLFGSFTQAVQESQAQLSDFKETISSDKSQEVFRYTSDSRRANPNGIKPWRARDDPNWSEPKTSRDQEVK